MEGEREEGRREAEPEEDLQKKKRRALEAVFGELSDGDDDGGDLLSSPSDDAHHLHHVVLPLPPHPLPSSLPHPQSVDGMSTFGQVLEKEASWERVAGIRGLWLCRDFLSVESQAGLLSAIEKEGWFNGKTHNQAMRFGDLPQWATELSSLIQEAACLEDSDFGMFDESLTGDQDNNVYPLPGQLLWREPLFDQLIVNVYEPGNLCTRRPDAL